MWCLAKINTPINNLAAWVRTKLSIKNKCNLWLCYCFSLLSFVFWSQYLNHLNYYLNSHLHQTYLRNLFLLLIDYHMLCLRKLEVRPFKFVYYDKRFAILLWNKHTFIFILFYQIKTYIVLKLIIHTFLFLQCYVISSIFTSFSTAVRGVEWSSA